MIELDQKTRAEIGKEVAAIAISAEPSYKKRHQVVSNWRTGRSLPTLQDFLIFCAATGTVDISPLLAKLRK
jgi:hypothetical protein